MALRMMNSVSFSQEKAGTGSVDPYGRPDPRWKNGTPPTYKIVLEVEFEAEDLKLVRALVEQAGGQWPCRGEG